MGVTVRGFDLGEWGADAQTAIRALVALGGEAKVEALGAALGWDLTRLNAVIGHRLTRNAATGLPILTRAADRGFVAYLPHRTWDGLPAHMKAATLRQGDDAIDAAAPDAPGGEAEN